MRSSSDSLKVVPCGVPCLPNLSATQPFLSIEMPSMAVAERPSIEELDDEKKLRGKDTHEQFACNLAHRFFMAMTCARGV